MSSAVLPLRERDLELTLFIVAQHRHGDGVSRRLCEQRLSEGRLALDLLVANAEDDVSLLDSRLFRWASLDRCQDVGSMVDRKIVLSSQIGRDQLKLDPDVWIRYVPVLDELAGDIGDVVGWNGKEQPLHRRDPGLGNAERVHTDHPPREIEQRPTRVTRVDRRVVLNEIGVNPLAAGRPRAGGEIAVERADDAAGDGSGELPERRPDSQHRLPLSQGIRIAERDRRRRWFVHTHDSEIAKRIGSDQGGIPLPAIGKDYLKPGATMDDVLIGHNIAGAVDNEPRATTRFDFGLAEYPLVKPLLVDHRDDGRHHPLDDFRCIESDNVNLARVTRARNGTGDDYRANVLQVDRDRHRGGSR